VEVICGVAVGRAGPPVVLGLVIVTRADILPETPVYDADCRRCERLASFLDQVRAANPGYFCRPVPPFGTDDAAMSACALARSNG